MFDRDHAATPTVRSSRFDAAGIALLALVVRLPALVANRHLTFDDGVYGSAALSMRHGNVPFRDVYSPQGPAHLATVWLFDLLAGRTTWSPRVASVVAGVVICVGVWCILAVVASSRAARWCGVVLALSGSLGWVTVPLAGDGIAIAWAVVAIAIALRSDGRVGVCALAGVAFAMALSTKVLVAPAVLLILAGIWCGGGSRNDRIRRFSAFGISTFVVVALWVVAFRPSLVWEQSIRYHASTPRITSMSHNLATLTNTALHRDLLLVVALVLCLATGWHSRRHFTSRHRLFIRATTAWLVATVVLLVVQKATFRAHVSHLVVPVVVLCALLKPLRQIPASQRGRPTLRTFALGCAAFAILIAQFRGLLIPDEYSQPERSAVAVLRALPTSALVITDEPGLAWSAHKEMPAWLVDPGIKRFFGNDLRVGPRSVYASLADPRVCAVAVWTYRYGSLLPHLAEDLTQHGFVDRNTFGFWTSPDGSRGPRQVWIRPSCAATRVSSR